jgi:hypothetical protein
MSPQTLIDRYAHDVANRLPPRLRADVTAELQALLREEFAAQPNADLDAAKALLVKFGAPDDVAARYAPPTLVVEARDTRLFWAVTAWTIGLMAAFGLVLGFVTPDQVSDDAIATELGERALQALGVITLVFWAIGAWRRNHPMERWNPAHLPPVRDPDHIHRAGQIAAILYFCLGTATLVAPTMFLGFFFGGHLPAAARAAFVYDPGFLALRGPVLLACMIAGIAVLTWATIEGRWRRATQLVALVTGAATVAAMLWVLRVGPIFTANESDQVTKGIMVIIAIVSVIDIGFKTRRYLANPTAPLSAERT